MATADTNTLFATLKKAAECGSERLGGDISADPYPVFLRLSWANERPVSCPFAFGKRKKSTGMKFNKKGGSAISQMALAANQFLSWRLH